MQSIQNRATSSSCFEAATRLRPLLVMASGLAALVLSMTVVARGGGSGSSDGGSLSTNPPAAAPTAVFVTPAGAAVQPPVAFDATGAAASDGGALRYGSVSLAAIVPVPSSSSANTSDDIVLLSKMP